MKTLLASPSSLTPKMPTTTMVDYYVRQGPDDGASGALVKNFRNQFPETDRDICNLLARPHRWNEYDTPSPNPASVVHARSWAERLYRDLRATLWLKPRVSADEDGEVVFEWWKGRKKLSIYVSPTTTEYVKVEKADSSVKMEDGSIQTPKDRRLLWHWLTS